MQLDSKGLEKFFEDKYWIEIEKILKARIELIRTEMERGYVMESEDKDVVPRELLFPDIKERQGELRSLRYCLNMPEILKITYETLEKEKANEGK